MAILNFILELLSKCLKMLFGKMRKTFFCLLGNNNEYRNICSDSTFTWCLSFTPFLIVPAPRASFNLTVMPAIYAAGST